MGAAALVLREVSDGVWREYACDGADPSRPSAPPVVACWKRALELGASTEGPLAEDHLLRGDALKEHTERTDSVLHLAAADIERVASSVSPRPYVLLLADAEGVVVSSTGGGEFSEHARRVRLIPGASWSESVRGTNAIGTAIAERRPVYVRGSAHLAKSYHDLVCYAAPIFDADGSLVAVLDATSTFSCADDEIGVAVERAADTIMRALRDRAFGRAGAAVRQTLARALERMSGVALLVEPPGRVSRMNAGARRVFERARAQTTRELLGLDMDALAAEAQAPRGLCIERAGQRYALRIDPIETFDGRRIALLVFLEPQARFETPARGLPPARSADEPSLAFRDVFSRDERFDEALSLARRIADSTLPVLLLAETGAGKELVARAIHAASRRAREPFVAVNCGAISPTLLESELFGYGSAAFTGAERGGRQGLFAAASGGSIFLDEVAEMPPAMQAALLRVLEDGTYRRVGEVTSQQADVRVISATCRDLESLVETGAFRRDLFYRLKGAQISVPPLRGRTDRAALAEHLLGALARKRDISPAPRLSPEVLALIESHDFPGNVRELQSVLDVSLILAAGAPIITPEHLPPEYRRPTKILPPSNPPESAALATLEATAVRRILQESDGNISLAAKRLGIARSTLYRMMRKHGM